jgi:hypothetical protein
VRKRRWRWRRTGRGGSTEAGLTEEEGGELGLAPTTVDQGEGRQRLSNSCGWARDFYTRQTGDRMSLRRTANRSAAPGDNLTTNRAPRVSGMSNLIKSQNQFSVHEK